MSDFRNKLNDYISHTFKCEDNILEDVLEQQAAANGPMMNIGPDQGKFIKLLVQMSRSRKILELGSYFGYSSIWFGRALVDLQKFEDLAIENYSLTCIEKSSKQIPIIEKNIEKASLKQYINLVNASGEDYFNKLIQEGMSFDLVFIDADKGNYPLYLKQATKLIKKGGLLLVDNVLGLKEYEVIDASNQDKRIKSIREFNQNLAASEDFEAIILTIQAGLAVALRV